LLIAVDLKDLKNPKVISKMDLPVDTNYKLVVSEDSKKLFMSTSEAFITLDISDKTSIKIMDTQLLHKVSSFVMTNNDQNILIGSDDSFQTVKYQAKYALYSSDHQFKLGKSYSNPLKILELNEFNTNYSSIGQNYKFIQASLYNAEFKPLSKFAVSYSILPNWMYFDKENALLNLDLAHQLEIATYQVRFSVSTEVLAESFLKIEAANYTNEECQNLQAYLVGQGYLDSERFLAPGFDENVALALNTQYVKYEQEIRKILKSHSIELVTKISIESSLELIPESPFQIKTPSMNSIHVEIELFPVNKDPKKTGSIRESSIFCY